MIPDLRSQYPDIKHFLETIEPWFQAYQHRVFTFVAMNLEGELVILRGALVLSAEPREMLRPEFRTTSLCATEVRLAGTPTDTLQFVEAALSGEQFPVPPHVLKFPPDSSGRHSAYHHPDSYAESPNSDCIECLTLRGARRWDVLPSPAFTKLERELRSASEPYANLNDLFSHYGFEGSGGDSLAIDIKAERVLTIDSESKLQGKRANLIVRLAPPLNRETCRVSVRSVGGVDTPIRLAIEGTQFEWQESQGFLRGVATLDLADVAVLTCTAVYAEYPQHEIELEDERTMPNWRRSIVQLVDPTFETLQRKLLKPRAKERDDFEACVWVLLQMLGFETMHLGAVEEFRNNADVFAVTPKGELLIVECTTGTLNQKDKLQKLVARRAQLKEMLNATKGGISAEKVYAFIVAPAMPVELGADRELAREQSVFVLGRPELEAALESTRYAPDADQILERWRALPMNQHFTKAFRD